MNSKTDDFPTPVSPTRRIVYGAFASFFDVLTTALLRDSTSLDNRVRTIALKIVLYVPYLIVGVSTSSLFSKAFSRGSAEL